MPADRFTKKATSAKDKRQWAHVYASAKKSGDSAGTAVRKANAVVAAKKKGRKQLFDRIEDALTSWSPKGRRRFAVHLLVWSLIAAFINVVLYVTGVIDENHLIFVTLVLSWLAITFTGADLIATTDVREESPDAG